MAQRRSTPQPPTPGLATGVGTDASGLLPLATGEPATSGTELPELMTSAEVAAALRLSAYQVRLYVRTGVLPAYRVGRELRIPRDSVARHLHSLRVQA